VNRNGLQAVLSGGSATRTTINAGGGQSVHGQATDSVLNGGEQWVQSGGSTTGTVISAGVSAGEKRCAGQRYGGEYRGGRR
jgi:antigen 43